MILIQNITEVDSDDPDRWGNLEITMRFTLRGCAESTAVRDGQRFVEYLVEALTEARDYGVTDAEVIGAYFTERAS